MVEIEEDFEKFFHDLASRLKLNFAVAALESYVGGMEIGTENDTGYDT